MHSSSTQQLAKKHRLQGKSYNEISNALKLSKSTLHSWFVNLQLPDKARQRIATRVHQGSLRGLLKRNRNQTHLAQKRMAQNRSRGRSAIKTISQRDLLLIGSALYWGEGYKRTIVYRGKIKTYHPISLANSDPHIIRIFIQFLRECLHVKNSAIKIDLHLYSHINAKEAQTFWAKITDLPLENFGKIYYGISRISQKRRGYNRLPHGTAHVKVNSTQLFHHLMGMIEGIILNV